MWKSGQQQPFPWSFEGVSGYGTHGDYLFGWKRDALERAMSKSECFYDGCGSLKKQDMSVASQCKIKDLVYENIDGYKWVKNMPG